ncbi:MAG TPA: YeeE/YedE family protein [Alphaproteobacteria bacterium]|nr:YeeE/YedE family protein [Alphaproteobacteria bacterium]
MDEIPAHLLRFGLGLAGGAVLGLAGRWAKFCTLGAIEDAVYGADWTRLRCWALAAALATALTQAMALAGVVDLTRSIYLAPEIGWLGAVVGGLMFGFGMALVGTCSYGTLLRCGGGDLRALVVFLVIAVAAYATMRGLTGMGRVLLLERLRVDAALIGGPGFASAGSGLAAALTAGIAVAVLLLFALWKGELIARARLLGGGLAIGAAVAFGWWITGAAADDPFDPARVESYSFVAPLGEALVFLMTASGSRLDFMEGSVAGVLIGAFVAARVAGEFRWEAYDDAREMKRHLLGAVLMGTGGIAALGCTIGQGITGVSTLSYASFLAIAAIFTGARAGLYWLVERGVR